MTKKEVLLVIMKKHVCVIIVTKVYKTSEKIGIGIGSDYEEVECYQCEILYSENLVYTKDHTHVRNLNNAITLKSYTLKI